MWGGRLIWAKIKNAGRSFTDFYLLRSLDLERDADSAIVGVPRSQAVYITVLIRTFYISALVTLITLALGYPVAFMLAHAPSRLANVLLIFILVGGWKRMWATTATRFFHGATASVASRTLCASRRSPFLIFSSA